MKYPGKLITLEGIDNVGKTTQVTKLQNFFVKKGMPAVTTKELTSPIGAFILDGLYAKSLSPFLKTFLFATDRAIRYERRVIPALQEGKIVIADRWTISAIVYRGLEGYDVDFVHSINQKIPHADLTLILNVPIAVSMKRGEAAGKPCPYTQEQLEEAQKRYLAYARQHNSVVIDSTKTEDQVFSTILKALQNKGVISLRK